MKALIVFPRRSSFTQAGAVPAPPLVLVDATPCAMRRWNARPFPGDTSMKACAESAVSRSRIMTPALTHACTYSTVATRAIRSASPERGCQTKCSASALPQTSAPPPDTLNVPFTALARPAEPTTPMSCDCHGAGSAGAGGGAATVIATGLEVPIAPALSTARAVNV